MKCLDKIYHADGSIHAIFASPAGEFILAFRSPDCRVSRLGAFSSRDSAFSVLLNFARIPLIPHQTKLF